MSKTITCNFCGFQSDNFKEITPDETPSGKNIIIQGFGVHICEDCVVLSHEVISDLRKKKPRDITPNREHEKE